MKKKVGSILISTLAITAIMCATVFGAQAALTVDVPVEKTVSLEEIVITDETADKTVYAAATVNTAAYTYTTTPVNTVYNCVHGTNYSSCGICSGHNNYSGHGGCGNNTGYNYCQHGNVSTSCGNCNGNNGYGYGYGSHGGHRNGHH